ncbi:glycoside hydrolase family 43 protein [Nemania sp. FL0916]|nr:glycoside hydrolase family 43 protein [Nemania sp. FL0916]
MAFTRALLWLLSLGGLATTYQHYDDSTITITSFGTPDPFVNSCCGQYFFMFTAGDRIEIWSSSSLVDIETTSTRHQIWKPPQGSNDSADIWAPELHAVRGRWYIYYSAANPNKGNKSHRMYVLGGPAATVNPCLGSWEFLGPILNMPDQWAIDGTPFEIDNQLYLAYSGNNSTAPATRPPPGPGLVQHLYVIQLSDPITASSAPSIVSLAQQSWEITRDGAGAHAINEGPQWLASPDGRWRGLAYSCAGSWTHEYKMATLRYRGGSPLLATSWTKSRAPLLQRHKRSATGPFGPGHGSFLHVGKGEVVAVYHATDAPSDGWQNRRARVQRVAFTRAAGEPYMGKSFGLDGPRLRTTIAKVKKPEDEDLRTFLEKRAVENEAMSDEM